MRCARCGTDNQLDSNFCTQCGNSLVRSCAKCGAESPAISKFCGKCGAPLQPSVRIHTDASGGDATGERRHLTVLFCDLVNSTAIASQLDPEEWREIVASYYHAAAEAIERFGGHVAQYLGDGVMAYFGWPEAYDNNAERAAHAGLAILEAISQLNESSTRPKLSARVGIDSGAVVVGAGSGKNAEVFGDTPNIAAHVQAAAPPDTVLMTADTYRLLSGLFMVEDYGKQTLKGLERQIQLYRVIRPSEVRGRLQAAAAVGALVSFVGRDDELRLLMDCWERALAGEGQVVLISGEGGIGKSRLVHRFNQQMQIAGRPYNWAEGAASPFFQHTPFYPVAGILQELLAQESNAPERASEITPARRSRTRLSGANGSNGHSENRTVLENEGQQGRSAPSLPQLELTPRLAVAQATLNLSTTPEHPALPQQQRRLLSTLAEWLLDTAHAAPLIMAIEDLHWADASTLELIRLLAEQAGSAPLMLLCTARPEFRTEWPPRARVTEITLNPLDAHNARMMVQEVAAQELLDEETIAAVVERGGGVPLFIEELTLAVLESGDVQLAGRKIPATLHDLLMARLDRLGTAKEVIQVGAVIGNEFSYQLIRAVQPLAEESLQSALRSLADAQLLFMFGTAPDATYCFKHALIRDAAYEALLKSRRKALHRLIGEQVEKQFVRIGREQPEFVAYHYTAAGIADRALHYWRQAARKAIGKSAPREAIAHLNQGLALINQITLPGNRGSEELQLQLMLINPLIATFGYTAPEVERASWRACELCEQLGDSAHRFQALGALCNIYQNRGDCDRSYEIAEQMMSLAEASRNRRWLMWAHFALAFPLQEWGEFHSSRYHFEQVIELYDSSHGGYVQDAGATARSFLAHALFRLGYPDQALHRVDEALTLARRRGEPYTLAMVLGHAGVTWMLCGELHRAQEVTEQMVAICVEYGFGFLEAMGKIWLGGIAAKRGKCDTAISSIRDGLGKYAATNAATDANWERAVLVRAYLTVGLGNEALNELAVLRLGVQKYRKHALEADMHQFMGEILLQLGGSDDAEIEHCFRQAIEVARRQCAKAIELSATISLVRLLMKRQRRDEARTTLAEIYNWFTEGFDTADLKEAKALLAQLQAKQ